MAGFTGSAQFFFSFTILEDLSDIFAQRILCVSQSQGLPVVYVYQPNQTPFRKAVCRNNNNKKGLVCVEGGIHSESCEVLSQRALLFSLF